MFWHAKGRRNATVPFSLVSPESFHRPWLCDRNITLGDANTPSEPEGHRDHVLACQGKAQRNSALQPRQPGELSPPLALAGKGIPCSEAAGRTRSFTASVGRVTLRHSTSADRHPSRAVRGPSVPVRDSKRFSAPLPPPGRRPLYVRKHRNTVPCAATR